MPVITLYKDRLSRLLKREVNIEVLTKWLPQLGLDLEEIGKDYVKVEYSPNRIDFSSHVGIARALSGLLELKKGIPIYTVEEWKTWIKVDPLVKKVRPYILGAIIRGIAFDEETLVELMKMQEDIHWAIGRNRRKVSIGVHDLDKVSQPFSYIASKPSRKFVPLDCTEELSLNEILSKHEKGKAYGYILKGCRYYPLVTDGLGRIMSFPPIINSELTRVTEKSQNLFIDVTGTNLFLVEQALNVFTTALYDMGGRIEQVKVIYPEHELIFPSLFSKSMTLDASYVRKSLGLNLTNEDIIESLKRSRLDARVIKRNLIETKIPPYRIDVLHQIDLVEEVMIGYGCYRMTPTLPKAFVIGKPNEKENVANRIRRIMIGLGFIEVKNPLLINEEVHYKKLRMKVGKPVKIANPVSREYTMLREWILPSLLTNLAFNKHEKYPQFLFEVSDVVKIEERLETHCKRILHVAAVISHAKATFTEIKAYAEALLNNLEIRNWKLIEGRHQAFIPGRIASIYLKRRRIGFFGEIHPEVLNNFDLDNSVCALEMNAEALLKHISRKS